MIEFPSFFFHRDAAKQRRRPHGSADAAGLCEALPQTTEERCLGRGAHPTPSCHPNQITAWKAQLESGAADVFGPGGGQAVVPAIDVKSLHAKIGELTLENDFLEGALTKAGLLSAKR